MHPASQLVNWHSAIVDEFQDIPDDGVDVDLCYIRARVIAQEAAPKTDYTDAVEERIGDEAYVGLVSIADTATREALEAGEEGTKYQFKDGVLSFPVVSLLA